MSMVKLETLFYTLRNVLIEAERRVDFDTSLAS